MKTILTEQKVGDDQTSMSVFNAVSIIIPVINETYLLRQTIDVIADTCIKSDIAEIIFVLCDKTTPACIQSANETITVYSSYPIKTYYQKEPFIAAAYKEPFMFSQGSHVIIMSADMETDPNQIKDFIESQKKYPDAVIFASRWIKGGGFTGYFKIKLVCNYIFNKMLSVFYFSRLSDMTYGYKSFPVSVVQSIDWRETKHPFFLEMALKPLRLGIEIHEIPSKWRVRTEGESQNSFFQNFKYFKTAFICRFISKSKILKPGIFINQKNE